MRIVIFSDLHNSVDGLRTVERYAQQHNADQLLYLGDLGSDETLLAALRSHEIACTFGNWEVSGLRRLPTPWAQWVAQWPAQIEIGDVCYTHATPDIPATVTTTAEAASYMAHGVGWGQLFPRLHTNEDARWAALAALETNNLRAAFHGHTHIQRVWAYQTGLSQARQWRSFDGPTEFMLEAGTEENPNRYLIGVGSAGAPQDGRALRFARYDEESRHVELVAVD